MYPKKLLFFYKKGTYVITFEIPFNFSTAAFGEGFADHVPLFGSLDVFALLLFETRLFCRSLITGKRVRLLERNFIAPMFDTQVKVEPIGTAFYLAVISKHRTAIFAVNCVAIKKLCDRWLVSENIWKKTRLLRS